MRTRTRRGAQAAGGPAALPVALALTLLAVVLTGCVPSPAPAPSATPTSSPTPHPTPVFTTDNQALVAATETYAAYLRTSDEILSHGGRNLERLKAVATGDALAQLQEEVSTYSKRRWRTVGNTTFGGMRLVGHSARSVTVYVCEDASNVGVVDASGTWLVPEDRSPRTPFEVQLVQRDDRLVLAEKRPTLERTSCP